MQAGGIVLCGGLSTRMGRSKAWLPIGAETMLQRVVRVVREVVEPVVVVAAQDQELPDLPSVARVVRDAQDGRGPLQGLLAGLIALDGNIEAAYLSSCDVPLLQPAFIRRMIDLLGNSAIAVPLVDGRTHPLAAVYRLTVRPAVESLITANQLRTADLFDLLPTRFVDVADLAEADPRLLSLRNINTPEEYAAVLRDFAIL